MRARLGLAEMLWYTGERPAAIEHLQAMLQLNPGDNQGLRYILAGWLLATKDDAALTTLLAQYPDEQSAQWAYSRVLLAFRRSRATKRAQTALEKAMEINRFVPLYLLGVDPLPKTLPQYYSPGDRDEAIMYLAESVEGWLETPEAIEWLGKAVIRLAVDLMSEREQQQRTESSPLTPRVPGHQPVR